MARPRQDHLPRLGEAAFEAFVAHGYRQSLVQDVATRLGLAVGTVYREVLGKEALFELAVRHAFGLAMPEGGRPLRGLDPEGFERLVRDAIAAQFRCPVLDAALAGCGAVAAPEELREVLQELYAVCRRQARAIRLLDRCAAEFPRLGVLHLELVKGAYLERFTGYVGREMLAGRLAVRGPAVATARAAFEAVAWMAIHRQRDALPPPVTEGDAEAAVIELLVRGLAERA